jgi:transposase
MILKATKIWLDPETRARLESWLRATTTEQRMVRRARIVLLAAEGKASRAIAREVRVMTGIVSLWRKRFAAYGIAGLKDKPRPGAKRIYTEATDKRILATLDQTVPKGRARWSAKLIATRLGDVHVNYVWRFLRNQKIDLAGRKSRYERTNRRLPPKLPT